MNKETILKLYDKACKGNKPKELQAITAPDEREAKEPYYYFLYLLAKEMKAQVAVELGTYIGTSAKHIAAGMPGGSVLTVDVNPDAAVQVAKEPVYSNILAVTGNSAFYDWPGKPIDILFLDTEHSYNTTIANWRRWAPHVIVGGVILFDDASLDDEMKRVMAEVTNEAEVIDLPKLHHTGFAVVIKQ